MKIKIVTHGYLLSRERYMEELEAEAVAGQNPVSSLLSSIGLDPAGRFAIFVDRKRVKGETAILQEGIQVDIFSIVGGG
ncbi:MAG: MoaD/ThiS family protein [Myxococcota bacterium]|jgi:sulfur carrier protein ThiS